MDCSLCRAVENAAPAASAGRCASARIGTVANRPCSNAALRADCAGETDKAAPLATGRSSAAGGYRRSALGFVELLYDFDVSTFRVPAIPLMLPA
jgi:hypothetical protein